MLLKERTLDEAPRPPKKAMDYSSSSEEVESSEDDEEESNGEPSEGSRDTPGGRYGASWGRGSCSQLEGRWFPFPRGGSPAITAGQFFLPFPREWGTGLGAGVPSSLSLSCQSGGPLQVPLCGQPSPSAGQGARAAG